MTDQKQADNLLDLDNPDVQAQDKDSPSNVDMSENFFVELDKQVQAGILGHPADITREGPANVPEQGAQTTSQEASKAKTLETESSEEEAKHNYEKRYKDSSREAMKLKHQLDELAPFVPILNAMRDDPNLTAHVRGYFEGGGVAPKGLKEQLGLGEDFVFDYDEALSNPNSNSGKLLNATIDGVVSKRLTDYGRVQEEKTARITEEATFRARHPEMTDEVFGDIIDYAKSHQLSMEDIYYLSKRGEREQNIAKNTQKEILGQMDQVRKRPVSAAAAGSREQEEVDPNQAVVNMLIGLDKELEEAFSL